MAKLADTGQLLMDLYYQNYKTDEGFFTLFHFMYLCGVVYSKILEDEYRMARAEAKQESGMTHISIQSDFLSTVEVEAKQIEGSRDYEASLPARTFSFPYDPYGFGVQSVRSAKAGGCQDFVRGTDALEWQTDEMPATSVVLFYSSANKIIFKNVRCDLGKVKIQYLPEVTDPALGEEGGDIPKSKEELILTRAFMLMKTARDGTVVDMSNNSNPNVTMATEVDNLFGNLRAKPV